jgi:hypothetical protein
MNWLHRIFNLPSPVDLGWSKTNALGARDFPSPGQKTWEDYYDYLKTTFPIRAFIAITVADWLYYTVWMTIKRPVANAYYWLVSHLIPSRRYHMLDLRQPGGYRYGWADIDSRLVYAMFNLLDLFVKHEMPNFYCPTEEEVAKEPAYKTQRDAYIEIEAIHRWWNVDRVAAKKAISDELNRLYGTRGTRPTADEREALHKMEADLEAKMEEMMVRLVKVRGSLWT